MIKKRFILPLIILAMLAGIATVQHNVNAQKVDRRTKSRLRTYLKDNHINGIILVNGNHGQPQVISNRLTTKKKQVITPKSLFPIGSLQKLITGVAIYHLVQNKGLKWDTSLGHYYPKIPGSDQVNIQQLMTYTSGLRNDGTLPAKMLTNEDQQEEFFLHHFKATTDHEWCYQDIDFQLLAAIIRKQTHQSYFHYVKQAILKPLKLRQVKMIYQVKPTQLPQTMQDKVTWPLITQTASAELGAGDLAISPNNYWKFITKGVLNNQRLIREFASQPKSQREAYFGGVYFQGNIIRANGSEPGYNCCFFADYRTKKTLMFFTNNIDYNTLRHDANDLYQFYYGEQIQP